MAMARGQFEGRSSSCFRKYRIFLIFVMTILCIQVYLAYVFITLDNNDRDSSKISSDELGLSRYNINNGNGKISKEIKLPPDKLNLNNNKYQKQLNQNRTLRTKLDYELLNLTPICDLTNKKEAISAVTRAKSQICKQVIVNTTCMGIQGSLYPERLYSSCPHSPGFQNNPKSLGCFKDDKSQRLLSYHPNLPSFKTNNSSEQCAFLCLQSGYPYAGTEYSVECFCGTEEPSQTKRLPDSSCNMKCPGDSKQSCGGYLTINVYKTGIQSFRAQEARNSSLKTGKEKPAKIAFLLTVNGRASRQVKRLISALYDPAHFYYIHVDARQDYMYREMLKVEKSCNLNNIKVAKGAGFRHASIWGGASLLTTLLSSARQMLQHSKDWDFLVNLSESDFPIKNNTQLVDFLTINKGLNFVKSHGREVQRFITKQGLDKSFVECEARMWRLGDRKLPLGIQIDGGSDWIGLSRDFVEYVSSSKPDKLISGLLKIFQYTLLPAESFFHTALRNSKYCDSYVDNNLHVTNWKRKLGCKCQYKNIVDWCGCSPNDFKIDDYNKIRNTIDKNLFFARKFEPVIDQKIINTVEEWLYPNKLNNNNNNNSVKSKNSYWQSLYHHADLTPPIDDVLLTITNSLARIIYSNYGLNSIHIKLLETTAYFSDNKFKGILIFAEANVKALESSTFQSDFPERLEALILLPHNFSTNKLWPGRIINLQIGTDYDQKEQIFRNFIGGIGPLSSPVLSYEFDFGYLTPRNLTIYWIDPSGYLRDINHIQIEESPVIGSIKPQLEEPLAIGKWNVVLFFDYTIIGQINYLVVPLSHWKNHRISEKKSKDIHNGPINQKKLHHEYDQKLQTLLKTIGINFNSNYNNNEIFEKRTGFELNNWIDDYVKKYYKIDKICTANKLSFNSGIRTDSLEKCSQTDWSSLSPDPKADINNICYT